MFYISFFFKMSINIPHLVGKLWQFHRDPRHKNIRLVKVILSKKHMKQGPFSLENVFVFLLILFWKLFFLFLAGKLKHWAQNMYSMPYFSVKNNGRKMLWRQPNQFLFLVFLTSSLILSIWGLYNMSDWTIFMPLS